MTRALPLTRRELEIARLAAAGDSVETMAVRMSLSLRSIETQLQVICVKLGISEPAELGEALRRLSP